MIKQWILDHMNDWRVLYKHASSWMMALVVLYEGAKLEGIDVSWLPHWIAVALGLLGLAAKLWRQGPKA